MHIKAMEIDISQRTGEVSGIINAGNFEIITSDKALIASLAEAQLANDPVAITSLSRCDNAENLVRAEAFMAGVEQGIELGQLGAVIALNAQQSGSALEEAEKEGYERGYNDGTLEAQEMANSIIRETEVHAAERQKKAVLDTVKSAGTLGFHEAKQLMLAKIDEQLRSRDAGGPNRRYMLSRLADEHLRDVRRFITSFDVPG